jgi:hypothetical protein
MLLVVLRQRMVPSSSLVTVVISRGRHLIFVRWLAVPLPAPFGF